jgi:hypothetical protein
MSKYKSNEINLKKPLTEEKSDINNVAINTDEEIIKHIDIEKDENFSTEVAFIFNKK